MRGGAVLALCAALVFPAAARGQVAWDSPMLLPPNAEPGFGIFLADMHGAGISVLGTWRAPTWNYGLRFGLAEGAGGDDMGIFGGIDFTGPVNRATEELPIDVEWLIGAGLGAGDGVRASFPAGLTAAYTFVGDGARFTPFLTPRVVLDGYFGDNSRRGDDSKLGLDLAVDLGLDLRLLGGGTAFDGMTIRFGATVGDRNAIALGLVF